MSVNIIALVVLLAICVICLSARANKSAFTLPAGVDINDVMEEPGVLGKMSESVTLAAGKVVGALPAPAALSKAVETKAANTRAKRAARVAVLPLVAAQRAEEEAALAWATALLAKPADAAAAEAGAVGAEQYALLPADVAARLRAHLTGESAETAAAWVATNVSTAREARRDRLVSAATAAYAKAAVAEPTLMAALEAADPNMAGIVKALAGATPDKRVGALARLILGRMAQQILEIELAKIEARNATFTPTRGAARQAARYARAAYRARFRRERYSVGATAEDVRAEVEAIRMEMEGAINDVMELSMTSADVAGAVKLADEAVLAMDPADIGALIDRGTEILQHMGAAGKRMQTMRLTARLANDTLIMIGVRAPGIADRVREYVRTLPNYTGYSDVPRKQLNLGNGMVVPVLTDVMEVVLNITETGIPMNPGIYPPSASIEHMVALAMQAPNVRVRLLALARVAVDAAMAGKATNILADIEGRGSSWEGQPGYGQPYYNMYGDVVVPQYHEAPAPAPADLAPATASFRGRRERYFSYYSPDNETYMRITRNVAKAYKMYVMVARALREPILEPAVDIAGDVVAAFGSNKITAFIGTFANIIVADNDTSDAKYARLFNEILIAAGASLPGFAERVRAYVATLPDAGDEGGMTFKAVQVGEHRVPFPVAGVEAALNVAETGVPFNPGFYPADESTHNLVAKALGGPTAFARLFALMRVAVDAFIHVKVVHIREEIESRGAWEGAPMWTCDELGCRALQSYYDTDGNYIQPQPTTQGFRGHRERYYANRNPEDEYRSRVDRYVSGAFNITMMALVVRGDARMAPVFALVDEAVAAHGAAAVSGYVSRGVALANQNNRDGFADLVSEVLIKTGRLVPDFAARARAILDAFPASESGAPILPVVGEQYIVPNALAVVESGVAANIFASPY